MEIGEAEAVGGEGIDIWRFDAGAVAREVGEAHVIGEDYDDVWFFRVKRRSKNENGEERFHFAAFLRLPKPATHFGNVAVWPGSASQKGRYTRKQPDSFGFCLRDENQRDALSSPALSFFAEKAMRSLKE